MNYDAAVRYLLSLGRELAAPTQAAAAKFDLENITVLSERLGRPDRAYPSAHIAGTNGKGSTAAFLESILRHAGFRTGLNTSPHLERINERIRVNGQEINDRDFAETLMGIQSLIEELLATGNLRAHPTYFECVTAIAFEYFARVHVDFGVFEVGLGGRLEVILARAKELGCPVIETPLAYRVDEQVMENGCVRARITEVASGWSSKLAPQLAGRFQLQNAISAVAAARALLTRGYRIPESAVEQGIAAASWPGRLEKLQSRPDIYADGAHNPGAARELAAFWEETFAGRKIFLLYGALRDKAVDEIAGVLFPRAAEVVFTEPRTSRAISASQLSEIAAHHAAHSSVIADAEQALDYLLSKAAPQDAVFVTGSLYLVGQLRHYWKQRAQVATR